MIIVLRFGISIIKQRADSRSALPLALCYIFNPLISFEQYKAPKNKHLPIS
jgi:hypothetical protein